MSDNSIQFDLALTTKAFELAIAQASKSAEDFATSLGKSTDEATKHLEAAGAAGKTAGEHIKEGSEEAGGAWEVFKGVLEAAGVEKAFELAYEAAEKLFDLFLVEGVKGAEESEAALTKLNSALLVSGDSANGTLKEFQEFAEQLSKNSTVEGDAIISQLALAKQYGLTNEQAKEVVKVSVDMAARGYDLDASVKQLSESFSGHAGRLQKLNPLIRDLTEEQLKAGAAAELLGAQFAGSAAAKLDTFEGSISQTEIAFKELQKAVGFSITQNPALVDAIKTAGELFAKAAEYVNDNRDSLKALITEGVNDLITALKTMVAIGSEVNDFLRDNKAGIDAVAYGLSVAATALAAYILVNNAAAIAMGVATAAAGAFNLVLDANPIAVTIIALGSLATAVYYVAENFDKCAVTVTDFTATILKKLLPALDTTLAVVASVASVFNKDLANSIISATDSIRASIDDLTELSAKGQANIDTQKEKDREATKTLDDKALADKLQGTINSDIDLSTQQKSAAAERLNTLTADLKAEADKQREDDIEKKNALNERAAAAKKFQSDIDAAHKEALRNYAKDEKEADENQRLAKIRVYDETRNREQSLTGALIAEGNARKRFDQENDKEKIAGVQSTLGSIATLQSSGNAELFEIGKAAAIAQATISTFQAATNALAAVPYPYNFVAAGLVAAAGAVQIAHIEETQRPAGKFAEGGIVPGSSFSGDNMTAQVNSGEGIFTMAQQKRLFNMANGQDGQGSGQDTSKSIDALTSAIMGQPIFVQIDGAVVATAVRAQVKGGFNLGVA